MAAADFNVQPTVDSSGLDTLTRQQTDEYYQDDNEEESRTEGGHISAAMRDKEKKIGHRRVDKSGIVSYKKKPTSELMAAIQLGIGQSVGGLSAKPERDVLMQDFGVVEVVFFPVEGSNSTPAHHYSDFRFKTYAPVAFRYFRDLFGIQPDDFMLSLCDDPLKELSNPGASGSIFYLTSDDEFIIKTVQHKEAEFLQKLLPGYFLNISQNKRTLLPKFYGLYCYQCGGKNIRFTVMNNLLPSTVKLHEKYDMKGSTYKRKASKSERSKSSPTLKDLDFLDNHPEGLLLEKDTYDALIETLKRDCRVLESFKIMDYSLLVGIYNLDQVNREKNQPSATSYPESNPPPTIDAAESGPAPAHVTSLHRAKSMRTRIGQYSTPLESIQGNTDLADDVVEDEDVPPGGIPARNAKGERLLLYLGIIDILQSFRLKKRLEHTVKSMVIDGDTISVHRPNYYAERFLRYHSTTVFKKIQSGLKHSPSKKRSLMKSRASGMPPASHPESSDPGHHRGERSSRTISFSDEQIGSGAMSGRPDLLPEYSMVSSRSPSPRSKRSERVKNLNGNSRPGKKSEAFNLTTYPSEDALSAGTASTVSLRGVGTSMGSAAYGPVRGVSPPLSLSESTPTHTDFTEGTPSFTNSSPSCSSDVMDMGNPNSLDAMGSPTSNSRSPDLRRQGNSSTRPIRPPTSPTGSAAESTDFSKTGVRTEVTVTVIPESPPPPFEAVISENAGRPSSQTSSDGQQASSASKSSATRHSEGNSSYTVTYSTTASTSSSSYSSQLPSTSATQGPGVDESQVTADAAASENEMDEHIDRLTRL